jgi:NAD(P)-dependent dehydrogenase (short-subunit alcohol dehydrogenase family)
MSDSILQRPGSAASVDPACVVVAGASGGIGSALCREIAAAYPSVTLVRLARSPGSLEPLSCATLDIDFDILDEASIQLAVDRIPDRLTVDWAIIATGWLHDSDHSPEKTFRHLDATHLQHAYQVNAIGPALLSKALVPRLSGQASPRIGILSARVGSISDNRLGGWHAYRASKAALNMLIRNFALELARKKNRPIIVGLQPGTTDTVLSKPFQRNVPEGQLQTPRYTAAQLLKVMQALQPQDSGGLFDFLGLPFNP